MKIRIYIIVRLCCIEIKHITYVLIVYVVPFKFPYISEKKCNDLYAMISTYGIELQNAQFV